jgi:hypothetical protein
MKIYYNLLNQKSLITYLKIVTVIFNMLIVFTVIHSVMKKCVEDLYFSPNNVTDAKKAMLSL